MKALTLNELRQMVGQPVWCPKENAYGIITCDKCGKWTGIPFLSSSPQKTSSDIVGRG